MKLMKKFLDAKFALLNHVGYDMKNSPCFYGVDDRTDDFWQFRYTRIDYGPRKPKEKDGELMYNEALAAHSIWRGEKLSMVIIRVNGEKYFMFFNNKKEVPYLGGN